MYTKDFVYRSINRECNGVQFTLMQDKRHRQALTMTRWGATGSLGKRGSLVTYPEQREGSCTETTTGT